MTNILICGQYGQGSIGDEVVLTGIINALSKYINDAKFSVITSNANETRCLHNVFPVEQSFKKGLPTFIKNILIKGEMQQVYNQINNCDVFILGGGTALQDLRIHYLPIVLSLIRLAHKKKKITVVYGVGAGPIETKIGKKLCKSILNKADLVTVRDSRSKIVLEKCDVENVIQTADPAFGINILNSEKINTILNDEGIVNGDNIISTTLYNWLHDADKFQNRNYPSNDLPYRREIMAHIYDHVIKEYNKKLMFLTTFKIDRDGYVEISKIMSNRNKTLVMDYKTDFNYILSLLSISDVLIGMRLHSLIIATMLGIPFVPISYSGKVKSFLELVNLNDLYIDIEDIDRQDFNEKLYDNFSKVWNNRPYYSNLLLKHSDRLRKKTIENAKLVSDLIEVVSLK